MPSLTYFSRFLVHLSFLYPATARAGPRLDLFLIKPPDNLQIPTPVLSPAVFFLLAFT